MKIVKLLRMGALLAAAIAFVGCEMTLSDEDSRKEVVEAKAKANAASGSGSGGGSTGTVEVAQNNVDGTYTAVAKKDWSAGAAGTMDLTSFDTSKGVALSFKIENTTTDQTCVFQADGNIQICAGYVWLSDELAFFEGDNTITGNTWEKAVGTHYETVCFNTDGSVDWYLDGVLTFNWTGKSTQVENLFKALKAGVVNILPQTNSTTDVTVSKISYSSALTAAEAKSLYDKNGASSTPAPTTDNSSQGENTGTNNSGNNGNNNSGNTENNNNSGNSGNGQGGESGTGTTVQNTVTGEGTIASPYVLKTTVVETYNGVESINAFSVQSTKGFDASAKIIWDNPLKNSTANAVTVSAKIYCPSVDGVNGFDSLIAFFKSANASNNNIAQNSCLGIYEGGAIHGNDWAGNYFDDKSILVKGEWVRVTIVISSEGVTYYHGNTSIASPAVTGNASAFITSVLEMDKVAVGVGGIWAAGYVDNGSYISNDIKIYSTALTAEQVAAIN